MNRLAAESFPRAGAWLALILLAVLAAVALLARPLTPIDETRYVSVAWEMWLRGDFLVPFKNGEPYSHKPPFMFWMFQAGWSVFGVHEWWPRLVSPLFAAGAMGLMVRLAGRLWPGRAGLGGRAALILTGSLFWGVFATSAMFDVLLAFWVLLGASGIWAAAEGDRRGFFVLGIAVGLGLLTKGPVVLLHVLPVAVLAPAWRPGLRWGRWAAGLGLAVLLGAAIALAWAIPAGYSGGDAYRHAIFWGQTADRMVDSFAHRRPLWWYLPLLPILLFPWFVWPGLWKALAHQRRTGLDRGSRFCLAWMLPVFVAFSFISGKQPHYLIPLFPAFALLAARVQADRPAGSAGLPALLGAALGVVLVLAATGSVASWRTQMETLPPLWPGLLLILAAAAAWAMSRRGTAGVVPLALLGTMALALLQWAVAQPIASRYDVGPMAAAIGQVQASGRSVANLATYHAQYQFAGRLEKPLVEVRGNDAAARWLAAHPGDYAVVYLEDMRDTQGIAVRHKQAYRGGAAVLVDARTAAGLLAGKND